MDLSSMALARTDIPSSETLYQGELPNPDYKRHPAYGGVFKKVSLADRIQSLQALWPYFIKEFKTIRKQKWDRQEAARTLIAGAKSPITRRLATDGAIGLQTNAQDKQDFLEAAEPWIATLKERRASIPGDQRTFMDNIQRIPHEQQACYQQITKMLETMGVLTAAREYLDTDVEVHTLNLMMGDATDTWMHPPYEGLNLPESPTVYMHMDTIYRMVKCIWYLTPVTDEDGPFCYVLGSHRTPIGKLNHAIRTANYKFFSDAYDVKHRKLFWSLPGFMRQKANFGDDLDHSNASTIQKLLEAEHRFTSEDGDLIFFDNSGFHRGSVFKSGSRLVLQIMLTPKRA